MLEQIVCCSLESGEEEFTSRVPTRETQEDCYPDFIKKYGFICLINITAITLIGKISKKLDVFYSMTQY